MNVNDKFRLTYWFEVFYLEGLPMCHRPSFHLKNKQLKLNFYVKYRGIKIRKLTSFQDNRRGIIDATLSLLFPGRQRAAIMSRGAAVVVAAHHLTRSVFKAHAHFNHFAGIL